MTEGKWLQHTLRNVLVGGMTACWLMSATVAWSADGSPILDRLNQLARDIHMSQKAVSGSGSQSHESAGAYAKEAATAADLQKIIFRVNSVEEATAARETIQKFGYRISTTAEKKAFQQAMNLLESRLKFLAQSESREFVPVVQSLEPVNNEIERLSLSVESRPGSRVKKIAAQADRSRTRSDASGRLGFEVKNGKTSFAVYSPDATSINLVLFTKPEEKTGAGYPMKKGTDGVWRCSIDGELWGKYYGFAADGPMSNGHLFDPKRLLSDPCALANVDHDGKSIVVKTDFTWTDAGFKPPSAKDVIIYEAHLKDLTAHSSSGVPTALRGKYLGMLEGQVISHLKDIGVNAVEFLPLQEFDNMFAGHMNYWGYMTTHFWAPETAYATAKNGEAVKEFKQMVNGLHKAGIAVIMDVVYNHTGEGNEKGIPLNFKGLDNPGYYRLCDDKKFYWNGTGCGNEFRSDNPMTRRYIVDSLKYWANEYHVDGFRFDLGTILDKETMTAIMSELPADTIIVAEPWACDWKRNQWGKSDFRNTKLGKWNDDFREKIRGFVKGEGSRNDVMTVLAGSCFWWTAKPTESVNFIECHDGATMNDLLGGNKARYKLGLAALLTAQGMPMLHEGMEMMKGKKGNDNSYDQDNEINWLNYDLKKTNKDIYDFFKGLTHLRRTYDNFKHATALNNQAMTWLQPANQNALGYHLKGDRDFLVFLNSDGKEWVQFDLPDQNDWIIVCNGDKVDDSGALGTAKGNYRVPPLNAIILKNRK